jgi:FKBP-type peptidyl-prolyl cis-trans isomerase
MKTLITVLFTIIAIFILLFAAKGIFGFEIKFEKSKTKISEQQNSMQEENTSTSSTSSQQTIQDITELAAQILQQGSGDRTVKSGDKITVNYIGMLLDGTKFDSSIDRGQPFSLTIGIGQVIPGWDQGIIGMKVGEKRRLFVPSELAYGEQGAGSLIKPNVDLVFDVELVSINNTEQEVQQPAEEPVTEESVEPTGDTTTSLNAEADEAGVE